MSNLRYIKKPTPIDVEGEGFTFDDFVKFLVSTCREFNATGDGIRAGLRLEDALEESKENVLVLRAELWELLHSAAERPTSGFPLLRLKKEYGVETRALARDCLPFIDAISQAETLPPKE